MFGYAPDFQWPHDEEGRRPPESIKPDTLEQAAALLRAVADSRLRRGEGQAGETGRHTVSAVFQEAVDLRVAANMIEHGWIPGPPPSDAAALKQPDSVKLCRSHDSVWLVGGLPVPDDHRADFGPRSSTPTYFDVVRRQSKSRAF
jgi:hypothetical protein